MGLKALLLAGICTVGLTAPALAQDDVPPTPFIVVDQFGYLPDAQKVAVIRDPETGFDDGWDFGPGATYQVIDTRTQAMVFEGKPVKWNNGAVDPSSGDRAWQFDFSAVTSPGSYVVRDVQSAYDSVAFDIAPNLYKPLLVQAVRTFFYQRAGFAKDARFAGEGWADGASHIGPGQDSEATLHSRKSDKSTRRNLSGGWYDAGDYNKYTSWTASYVVTLLGAYEDNPAAFSDDFNIPESGNGVSDLLDEVKFGLDWLVRMQDEDGGVLSIVALSHASPPSSATGHSYYGPATTSASYAAASAFAYGASVYGRDPRFADYAADLKRRAARAWAWAEAHPNATFYNNDARDKSEGIGAGQQETDGRGRAAKALTAAVYLYGLTGEAMYRDHVDSHYREAQMMREGYNLDFAYTDNAPLLDYARMPGATTSVVADIRRAFADGFELAGWGERDKDPYRAHISAYTWGSSATKSVHGSIFAEIGRLDGGKHSKSEAMEAAEGYLHYLHGVNPLGKVYLSNMKAFGAENSVDRFYHSWFAHGSSRWAA
ncbi:MULTISPECIES: glycoside hydrolase family 9 protein [Asticcacaulis]|uniref:glycoside hydrolase family 9 protein n=1 Tax=Asticcacaulis TaxID=76890 RepID=UPI001AE451A6|nr:MULTISPECIES: glycoside hydrolase family 9 protein [Asticcacaulis]MBP2159663.1 hypothetical protein [Asticcacaulis solisilvae]MDR6800510.1 hypothetical protein [Asticcacaulis sp. BE141]